VPLNGYFVHNTGTLRVQMLYIWVQLSIFISKMCPLSHGGIVVVLVLCACPLRLRTILLPYLWASSISVTASVWHADLI